MANNQDMIEKFVLEKTSLATIQQWVERKQEAGQAAKLGLQDWQVGQTRRPRTSVTAVLGWQR